MSADFHDLLAEAFPEARPPRRHLRFSSDAESPTVRFTDESGHEVVAVLDNESFSGIAAIVTSRGGLRTESPVSVDYFGHPVAGIIRRISAQPDGTFLVGIEWN